MFPLLSSLLASYHYTCTLRIIQLFRKFPRMFVVAIFNRMYVSHSVQTIQECVGDRECVQHRDLLRYRFDVTSVINTAIHMCICVYNSFLFILLLWILTYFCVKFYSCMRTSIRRFIITKARNILYYFCNEFILCYRVSRFSAFSFLRAHAD